MSDAAVVSRSINTSAAASHDHERGASDDEAWRVIPGSDGYYSVSDLGRVRSEPIQVTRVGRQRGRVLTAYPDTKGYPQFRMCVPGKAPRTMKVHRAVALAFLGPRPTECQINHRSGDKTDNRVSNLEYVTCRANVRHAWDHGLRRAEQTRGERCGTAKLNEDAVRHMRRLRGQRTLAELAQEFGVSTTSVSSVLNRRTWKHVN